MDNDRTIRVLILEDSPIDAALVVDELKQAHYNLYYKRIETPEDMKNLLYSEPWDLIISDYTMPRFSALAGLKVLQDSGLDIPFIIVSGSIGEDLAVEALKKGASDYLMKDNLARFVPAVERELREASERKARHKIEKELKETENSYQRLVENVKDYGIFLLNLQGKIISWNQGAEHIFGYKADEIIGRDFSCLYAEKDIQTGKPHQELEITMKNERHEAESIRVKKNGDPFYANGVITTLRNESGMLTGFAVVTQDITQHKEAEDKIRKLAQELEQRVKERTAQLELVNKELESFSYSVSHDLRAPLRNLAKLCEILLDRYGNKLDDQGREYLQFVLVASTRMTKLINDLLDLSRVSKLALCPKTFNISELVEEVVRELREAEPQRQVETRIKEDVTAHGDQALLKIVLQNLLENAWKFTGPQPKPVVEFGTIIDEEGKTAYYIRDNGVGYDPDYTDKLFVPFQRLHREDEFPGSGVGLATVQRIIHRHGGRVWAQGNINQGATFYFTL